VAGPAAPEPTLLQAELQVRLSQFALDATLAVASGEVVALLGPSGAGKSTVLRALSGLLHLNGGRVVLDGTVLEEPSRHIHVAAEKRPVAMMFQEYLLFPHLSALENAAFGLRARGMDRNQAREKARAALELLGVDHLASSRPRQLSGGQQQRVAMARALVTEPKLMLLDEPLAALDVAIRGDLRRYLRTILHQTPAASVLVTHDLLDAVAIADRMMVIEDGHIVQSGTPAEVTARPRSQFVARLVGVNLLRGSARATVVDLEDGGQVTVAIPATGPVLATIAPAAVRVCRDQPQDPGANNWSGEIRAVDLLGDRVRVQVEGSPTIIAEVMPSAVDELKLDDGGRLWVTIDPSDIKTYPP